MKRLRLMIAITVFLLLLSLFFMGCHGRKPAEISEQNADDLLPPTVEPFSPPLSGEPSEESSAPDPTPPTDSLIEEAENDPSLIAETEGPTNLEQEEEGTEIRDPSPSHTYTAACASANVNVRAGAGMEHPILFTLKRGESLPYLERQGDGSKSPPTGGSATSTPPTPISRRPRRRSSE